MAFRFFRLIYSLLIFNTMQWLSAEVQSP